MEFKIKFGKTLALGITIVIIFSFALIGFSWGYITNLMNHVPQSHVVFYLSFILFGFFLLSGVWMILYAKKMIITDDKITLFTYKDSLELCWDEIKFVKENSDNMIIGNETKYLALPSASYWTGKQKRQAIEYLNKRIAEKNIKVRFSIKAILPFSKGFQDQNTKKGFKYLYRLGNNLYGIFKT